ncbi:MAG: peptide-methionine (S)-S-oxide reductase MsrA [Bacteroidales bacterium]|nr:peptide-methionine (S)-S-oxide reductase MsrA [Bacteroidales bacterium]
MVVPVIQHDRVVAVLDIDSRELGTFDEIDKEWLEKIVLSLPAFNLPESEIFFAAGCFWGAEKYLKLIEGVTFTEVGFANGNTDNPTYKEVYTDQTGYAETVHLRYNPTIVSLRFLLEMYFKAIDPTSLNKQGEDEGTRYRTGIYYNDPADLPIVDDVVAEEAKKYGLPLQVEVKPLRNFYPADEYHQDYLDKNPSGYCHLPIALFELARKAKDPHKSN